MKHIQTFESFLNEAVRKHDYYALWNKHILQIIKDLDFPTSYKVVDWPDLPKKYQEEVIKYIDKTPKLHESFLNEANKNSNSLDEGMVIDVALGVATGLLGLWAVAKGLPIVGNVLGNAAESIATGIEAKAKEAAKKQRKELVGEIIKKFDGDKELQRMYQNLPEYSQNAKTKVMIDQNKERTKQLKAIGNYIKGKLTPEEMEYFTDISSMLRTGDIK